MIIGKMNVDREIETAIDRLNEKIDGYIYVRPASMSHRSSLLIMNIEPVMAIKTYSVEIKLHDINGNQLVALRDITTQ